VIAVGQKYTREYRVTPKVYQGFLDVFEDHNPMHVDSEFAAAHGFKERIMHGNILNGFLSHFVGECLPYKKVVIMSQTINFHRPFFEKDTLLLEAEVKGMFAEETVAEFKFKFRSKANNDLISKGSIQVNLLA